MVYTQLTAFFFGGVLSCFLASSFDFDGVRLRDLLCAECYKINQFLSAIIVNLYFHIVLMETHH